MCAGRMLRPVKADWSRAVGLIMQEGNNNFAGWAMLVGPPGEIHQQADKMWCILCFLVVFNGQTGQKRILHKKKVIQLLESPIHHTVPPDDHLQEACPNFDNHEKGMKNAFLIPFTMR